MKAVADDLGRCCTVLDACRREVISRMARDVDPQRAPSPRRRPSRAPWRGEPVGASRRSRPYRTVGVSLPAACDDHLSSMRRCSPSPSTRDGRRAALIESASRAWWLLEPRSWGLRSVPAIDDGALTAPAPRQRFLRSERSRRVGCAPDEMVAIGRRLGFETTRGGRVCVLLHRAAKLDGPDHACFGNAHRRDPLFRMFSSVAHGEVGGMLQHLRLRAPR